MHELALMEEVRRIALAAAAAQGARRIHAVKLSVGRLSGVDPDALAFAFEVVMAGGLSAGRSWSWRWYPPCAGARPAMRTSSRWM